jgi:hypothetical protein
MRLEEEQETELTLNRCPEGLFDELRTKRGVGDRPVVTRNVEDLAPTGVAILNPWEWQP